jgi:hypothetical protein
LWRFCKTGSRGMSRRRDLALINWAQRFRETGAVAPGQMGGRKPKAIAGEHAVFLAWRVRDGAFTLRGLMAELAARGLKVDYRSVWNFVHAEKLSFKKPSSPATAIGLMSRGVAPSGRSARAGSTPSVWCSSTRRGRRRTWSRCEALARRGERLVAKSSPRSLENHNLRRLSSLRSHRGVLAHRRSDQRRRLSNLCRESAGSHAQARRPRDHGQPRQPQGEGYSQGHPLSWGEVVLSPQILARPEPDRTGLRQAQASAAQSGGAKPRGRRRRRPTSRRLKPRTSAPTPSPTPATAKPKFIAL